MLFVDFVTLFPEMVLEACGHSILGRAQSLGRLKFRAANPRDFSTDKHRTVDDTPFGGGPGMLLKADMVAQAIESLITQAYRGSIAIVLCDPVGKLFTQADAQALAQFPQVMFVCGHYEGIDDRIRQLYATHVFSIGDYVLTGGELPALVMADATARFVPGVLGSAESLTIDSHAGGLLSAPQFTRPLNLNDLSVPSVLLTGDHPAIAKWKRAESLKTTRANRPDLFCRARLEKGDADLLSS